MKSIAFKVPGGELARLNYYKDTPEGGETIISKFVRAAIREKCERTRHLRSGGLIVTFPNPDMSFITNEDKAKILEVLKEADFRLSQVAPGVVDLSEVIAYYHWHFFRMTDRQRGKLEANFEGDLKAEAGFDAMDDTELGDEDN